MSRFFAFLIALIFCDGAWAASFAGIHVVSDGSIDPPGDRVQVDVLFYPDETEVELEIRAIAAPTGEQRVPERPVQTTGPHKDPQGMYLQRVRLRRANGAVATATAVVAYADLALPVGNYTFGYQVTGSRNGRVEFTAASDTTVLEVSSEPRFLTPKRDVAREVVEESSVTLVIPDAQADGGYRVVETVRQDKQIELEPVPIDEPPIAIPRGFRRRVVYSAANADEEQSALGAEINRLSNGVWLPRPSQALYYATNRNVVDRDSRSVDRFGIDGSSGVTYGSVRVNVPAEHTPGQLERARWWERNDPRRHFYVDTVNSLNQRDFLNALRPALTDNSTDTLLFVHGFNTSFEFAALRLAQFKNDIRFSGPAMFFSWPSAGSLSEYQRDEREAAESEEALRTMLKALVQECRARQRRHKIHLVAHSMGNRVLLGALERLAADLAPNEKPFGHLVLAAPDIDVRKFISLLPRATQGANTVTLYFNKDDRALQLSRGVHLDSRVGEGAVFMDPLLNIDARRANTSVLGHDLFVSRDVVLVDLEMLLNIDLPPSARPTLRTAVDRANKYWMFP